MSSSDIPDNEALIARHAITYLNAQLHGLWTTNEDNLGIINNEKSGEVIHTSEQRM